MFENFWGNAHAVSALERMIERDRIPQTLLLSGPEGIGKATLARRFGARVLGGAERIEQDDLSLPGNTDMIAAREKWQAEKRNEDPLLLASHPDFVTFPPDGPMRQISIPQMRRLKEAAPYKPSKGARRVFLIDHVDRANDQAANSLLKTLEEPPEHLILIMTAENAYDLLPTIRSRATMVHLTPLSDDEMRAFAAARKLDNPERRVALAAGSPGAAVSLDLDMFDRRRAAMFALLRAGAGASAFGDWMKHSETEARSRADKLDSYIRVLYMLLRDLLVVRAGGGAEIRTRDFRQQLEPLARKVSFEWIESAARQVDELVELARRNIQKTIALDALALELKR